MSASVRSRNRTRVTATPVRSSPSSRSAIPPITSCQRPDSSRSQRSASAASAGLPWARPSQTTMLSAASTRSPWTARSFKRAFWTTSSRGSPSVSSCTSGFSTRNSTPSCSRIARRRGELEARISSSAELREEQPDLAGGGLRRVGAVDHVGLHLQRVVAADRPWRGLERVRGADHLPRRLDRLISLEHERHQRAAGDELDQVPEERALTVLGVVPLGELPFDRHVLHRDDPKALALKPGDDLAGEAPPEGIGLYENECAVHQPADWGRSRPGRGWRGGTAPAAAAAVWRGRRRG